MHTGGLINYDRIRRHIASDVAVTNPCQIICAQEVDPEFSDLLSATATRRHVPSYVDGHSAASSSSACSSSNHPAVAGFGSGRLSSAAAGPAVADPAVADPAVADHSSSSCPAVAGDAAASSVQWPRMSPNIVVAGNGCDDPWSGWHVVRGDEDGSTCIVAGKRSVFKSVTRLEWHRTSGGQYKSKSKQVVHAWSRIIVAELVFWTPRCGREKVVVCSVHMHRDPAARRPGFVKGADEFWLGLHHRIARLQVNIIGGDFNMALWDVGNRLGACGSQVTLVSAYAWRHVGVISAVAEEHHELHEHADSDGDIPPPPPPPPPPPFTPPPPPPPPYVWNNAVMPTRRDVFRELQPVLPVGLQQSPPPPPPPPRLPIPPHDEPEVAVLGQLQQQPPRGALAVVDPEVKVADRRIAGRAELLTIRSDSCGVFVVGKPAANRRILVDDHFTGPKTFDLPERLAGPGFPLTAYVGSLDSVRHTLRDSAAAAVAAPTFPVCKEKCMHKFDPTGQLLNSGAHMPLAVFFGNESVRSRDSVVRRRALGHGARTRGRSDTRHSGGRGGGVAGGYFSGRGDGGAVGGGRGEMWGHRCPK